MEVYTTNDFVHDGIIYHPELDLEQPKGCLSYTSNHVKNSRKINNRSYDINTSNYKDLIYNGKTLNYSRIKFYNLKNITDSQTKLLLYKYVNIDNALNKDKYSEVQFISYTSLFKNAFKNSNLDIDKYIYDSTKVNK